MSNSIKNLLQITVVIILLAGVGYLGFRLVNINTAPTPSASQLPTNDSPSENAKTSTASENGSLTLEARQCNTADDCTVILEPSRKNGKEKTLIGCLSKTYLDTCIGCSTNEVVVEEATKEASCGCVNNLCQFDRQTN
jgi:hypothetical protein